MRAAASMHSASEPCEMTRREILLAARRRLAELKALSEDRRELRRIERRAKMTPAERQMVDAMPPQAFRLSPKDQARFDAIELASQMRGFIAGWLVGSGQFSDWREIFGIWLEAQDYVSCLDPSPPSLDQTKALLDGIMRNDSTSRPARSQ